ncbi:MAG: hypothetical protein DRM99_02845 [Thermoplasmata archaeon]|nr:MAG: hypothetical protein DRM99_02845 [Thermoplasmata archaeon]
MREIVGIIAISMILILLLLPSAVSDVEDINVERHEIDISTIDTGFSVKESLTIKGDHDGYYSNLTFWIPHDAKDIIISINDHLLESPIHTGENIYNVSDLKIEVKATNIVKITYKLGEDIKYFNKILVYPTTSLSVVFNGKQIYSGKNFVSNNEFTISLESIETPLSWYIVVFVILLVVLLVVSTAYSLKKQKSSVVKKTTGVSEELLTTKKALLMEVLKDIEKQHRAEKISDDTYHKLKEEYKHEAVETMKQLEDIKSKVK